MCLTMRTEFCHLAIIASVSNSQNLLLESVFLFSLGTEQAPYSAAEPSSAGSQHQMLPQQVSLAGAAICIYSHPIRILSGISIPSLQRPLRLREGTYPRSPHQEGAGS